MTSERFSMVRKSIDRKAMVHKNFPKCVCHPTEEPGSPSGHAPIIPLGSKPGSHCFNRPADSAAKGTFRRVYTETDMELTQRQHDTEQAIRRVLRESSRTGPQGFDEKERDIPPVHAEEGRRTQRSTDAWPSKSACGSPGGGEDPGDQRTLQGSGRSCCTS
jgi:hypothetical protein